MVLPIIATTVVSCSKSDSDSTNQGDSSNKSGNGNNNGGSTTPGGPGDNNQNGGSTTPTPDQPSTSKLSLVQKTVDFKLNNVSNFYPSTYFTSNKSIQQQKARNIIHDNISKIFQEQ